MGRATRQGIPLFAFYSPNSCYEWDPLELLSWAWICGGWGVGTHKEPAIVYQPWPRLSPGSSTAPCPLTRRLSFLKLNPCHTLPRNHLSSQGGQSSPALWPGPCLLHATGATGEEAGTGHISFALTKGSPRQGSPLGDPSGQLHGFVTRQELSARGFHWVNTYAQEHFWKEIHICFLKV